MRVRAARNRRDACRRRAADVVRKAQHRFVIGVGPLHRDLEDDAVALAADRNRRRVQRLFRTVEILHKGFETAVVMERHGFRLGPAKIGQHQGDAAVQEGEFAQPVFQRRKVEFGLGECVRARQKRDLGAGHDFALRPWRQSWRRPDFGQRRLGHAVMEAHEPLGAAPEDAQIEQDDSALTTDTPTPCKPPETL